MASRKKKLSLGSRKNGISSKEPTVRELSSVPHCSGIANLGNTCYINSIIQALKHCPRLLEELQNANQCEDGVTDVYQEFVEVLQDMADKEDQAANTTAYKPHTFVKLVQDTLGFGVGIQHDGQEMLGRLLSCLKCSLGKPDEDMDVQGPPCKVRRLASPGATRKITHFFTKADPTQQQSAKVKQINCISQLFEGVLKYDTKCLVCETGDTKRELFFTISLPVVGGAGDRCGPYSVSECLNQFCKTEYLSGDNKYYCSKGCRRLTEARRSITFCRVPQVLILHLNRFSTHSQNVSKVCGSVAVPLTVSVGQWCIAPESPHWLFAVVFHSGTSCHSGHYVTVARGNGCHGHQWLMYDDDATSIVSHTSLMNYLSPISTSSYTPYILFYKKENL